MHEPEVSDEMIFRLVIEHRDLLRLLGPYMRPGCAITFSMVPFGSPDPPFACKIVKHSFSREGIVLDWEVFGDGQTLEQAAESATKSAKMNR